jgi:uncharacterized protein (DUF488 family)
MTTFFTIGHSTRSLDEFAGLAHENGVQLIVDVRSMPRSRTNPQFNKDSLPDSLAPRQLGYQHLPELGGLRGKAAGGGVSPNSYWRVRGFRNYADYALTPPFAAGLTRLRQLGQHQRCAIMCAEAVWWRCHRRIIADYLLAGGEEVVHILGPAKVDQAQLTEAAVVGADGLLRYPGEPQLL